MSIDWDKFPIPKKPDDPGHAQFKEDGKVIVHASTKNTTSSAKRIQKYTKMMGNNYPDLTNRQLLIIIEQFLEKKLVININKSTGKFVRNTLYTYDNWAIFLKNTGKYNLRVRNNILYASNNINNKLVHAFVDSSIKDRLMFHAYMFDNFAKHYEYLNFARLVGTYADYRYSQELENRLVELKDRDYFKLNNELTTNKLTKEEHQQYKDHVKELLDK